uniref:DUF4371 domain-containing protein n=1 Tax=Nothobranchius furzeri TaxID=105023 RepID=A0A8C6KUE3_NOTFU
MLYCFICMAFGKRTDSSLFISGMSEWKHIHQRTEEHERSSAHRNCAEAYLLKSASADISSLFCGSQMTAHREQVKKRRQVLERIIDVIKVLGKRGLAYRRSENEAAYTLEDNTVDHGNFLELILLLGKYDFCLKEHLDSCIEESKKLHLSGGTRGRGSLVTFLSKTTVNSVIDAIHHLIQENISHEIKKAGMFSVQLDTTQDISSQDQCSIIMRYVTDVVNERLVAVLKCSSSTGQAFVDMLSDVLEKMGLSKTMCIGNVTDGASNMQGHYKGFSSLLSAQSPNQVHVWCYAHVLNLVLANTTQVVIESGSLFALINGIAVFIKESHQRMNVWEETGQNKRRRILAPIGETRWWAKHEALKKVFGSFGKPENGLYVDVLLTLSAIQKRTTVKPSIRVMARGYAESLLKYETILTAQIFLRIFEHTSPLSKYLQTAGLDILSAHRMVVSTQDTLKSLGRDFESVKKAADTFVKWTNTKIQEKDDMDIEVEATLPQKRKRMKKVLPGEMAQDETLDDAEKSYQVNVHNQIMDTAIEAIHRRFLMHGNLYADLACLDPRHFPQLCTNALPQSALQDLSKCLQGFDSRATKENIQAELKSFALQWNRLKASPLAEYKARTVQDGSDGEENNTEEVEITPISCCSCKECPLCCYQILCRFNMLTDAYPVLGLAYKYLLTLSLTQVACERTFSILKFIKNRLRSTLSSDKLEAFMLMASEKDILMALDSDSVMDRLAEKSELLKKLLH